MKKLIMQIIFIFLIFSVLNASIEMQQLQELFNGRAPDFLKKELQIYDNDPLARHHLNVYPQRAVKLGVWGRDVDTVRVLVLKVEFQLDSSPLTTGDGKFNYQGNGEPEYNSDGTHNLNYDPPHDSAYFDHQMEALRWYYWSESKHRMWIDYHIFPLGDSSSYVVPHDMVYYGDPYNIVYGLFYLLRDAVYVADRDTVADIDFSDYDAIILFHAGSMWQTDYGNTPYDLPAVWIGGADGLFGEPIYANNRTDEIYEAVMYSETAFQDGAAAYLQGGLAHEFGHQLGAFDLYDVSGYTMGCNGWSLHGTGNWNLDGLVPPHEDIWNVIKMNYPGGLLTPVTIDDDTTVELRWRGSLDSTAVFAIEVPINNREYYLITYRFACTPGDTSHVNPDSNATRVWRDGVMVKFFDYDYSLPLDDSTGGLIIWHVDRKADSLAAEEINEINAGFPHGVDIEEADGIQDCELYYNEISDWNATFYGNKFDLWRPDGQHCFDLNSNPNTNDNFGSVTHIRIDSIEIINDTIIRFNVNFDWKTPNFPFSVVGTFDVNSPTAVDLDFDGELEIITNTENGKIYAFRNDGSGYLSYPSGVTTQFANLNGNSYTSVAVAQADGDSSNGLEIVAGDESGYIYAWHSLPSEYPPQPVEGFPVRVQARVPCSPVFINLDDDSDLEVVIGANDNYFHAYNLEDQDNNGAADPVPGFPYDVGSWAWSTPVKSDSLLYLLGGDGILHALHRNSNGFWEEKWRVFDPILELTTSSLALGDINRDGLVEVVVVRGDSSLHVVTENGDILWSRKLDGYSFVTSPSLGDIDDDGYLDIVTAAGCKVYAHDMNGSLIPGFPVDLGDTLEVQSSPVIGDVNGDQEQDIIIGTIGGWVCGYNHQGQKLPGFPLSCGDSVYSTPTLVDINNDGLIELLVAADDSKLYSWTMSNLTEMDWPMFHLNPQHHAYQTTPAQSPRAFSLFSDYYVWPNPVEEGVVHVRYILSDDINNVDIDIYDIAGDKIMSVSGSVFLGINDNEIDVSSLAGGIYLVRIEAINGSDSNVQFVKMAVVK